MVGTSPTMLGTTPTMLGTTQNIRKGTVGTPGVNSETAALHRAHDPGPWPTPRTPTSLGTRPLQGRYLGGWVPKEVGT